MRSIGYIFFLLVPFSLFGQRDISVYNGTLYWVGRAAAPIDARVGGVGGTTYASIGTNSWYHPDNWSLTSGGVSAVQFVPGKLTNVVFDGNPLVADCRLGNANVGGTISGNAAICGYSGAGCPFSVTLANGYLGSITFATGWELHVQAGGKLEINSGQLSGGDDRILLNNGADFTLTGGGSFWIPTGSKFELVNGDFLINGGTFNHNNATVVITGGTINTNGSQLYNLILAGNVSVLGAIAVQNHLSLNGAAVTLNTNTITVGAGALATATTFSMGGATTHANLPNPPASTTSCTLTGGIIDIVNGSLYLNNTNTAATFSAGTGILQISGSQNQTLQNVPGLFGTTPQGCLPTLRINKPSGTLSLAGLIAARGAWQHIQGNVDPGTSTVYFRNNAAFSIDIPNPLEMKFNHVVIHRGSLTVSDYLNVDGNFTINAGATLTGGTASSDDITIAGDFSSAGTFTAPILGSVYFDGTTQSVNFTGAGSFNHTIVQSTTTLLSNLLVNGNLTISSTGVLDAAAQILTLTGNWINGGVFVPSTSTISFSGTQPQTISATPATSVQNYYNLKIDNSTGISISAPAQIQNQLLLTTGTLTTSNSSLLTLSDGSMVAGGGATSYIIGPVRKLGNDYPFTFHVGSVGRYAPARLFDAINTTDLDEFTVEYFPTAYNDLTNFDPASTLSEIGPQEFWNIQRGNGLIVQTKVELSWNTWSNVTWNVANTVIGHYDESNNFWEPAAGSFTYTGTQTSGVVQTSEVVTSYSPFDVGAEGTILPVTLTEFKVRELPNGYVELQWTTASELKSDYFLVSRSFDGRNFEKIDSIKGSGTTDRLTHYSSLDKSYYIGKAYYSLTQVDFDGTTTYYPVILHQSHKGVKGSDHSIIYPTILDCGETVHLLLGSTNENEATDHIKIIVFTSHGLNVSHLCTFQATAKEVAFDTKGLQPGLYIVQSTLSNKTEAQRFLLK